MSVGQFAGMHEPSHVPEAVSMLHTPQEVMMRTMSGAASVRSQCLQGKIWRISARCTRGYIAGFRKQHAVPNITCGSSAQQDHELVGVSDSNYSHSPPLYLVQLVLLTIIAEMHEGH